MKKLNFICLIDFLFITETSISQWNPCLGIEGGEIDDIIHHDTSIYIIVSGAGVFRRGISEQSWSEKLLQGAFWKIRSTIAGLFCIGYGDFYRSLDNGVTWDQIELQTIAYDLETCDSVVFIVTEEEILRSSDQGDTWTNINPFPNIPAYDLILHANDNWIFCTENYGDSISYSDDFGDNWEYIPLFDSAGYISDAYLLENKIWLSYRIKGGYSYDGISAYDLEVSSWSALNDSIPAGTDVRTFFIRDSLLRCGTEKGIFHLDPQDSIWISDNNNGLESKYITDVCVIGDSTWVATSSGPFFSSGNFDWLPDYNGLYQREVFQVFKNGSRLYALSGNKLYYSDSIESGFEVLNTQGLNSAYEIILTDTAWYAGSSAGFLISIDSGLSWISHSDGLEGKAARDIALTSGYYFCSNGGAFRTRNDSIGWERVPNDLGTANVLGVSSLNDILFAWVYMAGLYRSEDNGTSFQHVPESENTTPDIHDEQHSLYLLKDFGPVLSTTGNCIQWDAYISGFIDYTMLVCMDVSDYSNSTILGGGLIDVGLYDYFLKFYENPQIEEGIDIIDNLPSSSYPFIRTVYNDNGRLFACPNTNGLYYRDDFLVNVEEVQADQINNSGIQIYPNPASERIIIDGPAKKEIVYIKVFDSKGLEILSTKRNEYHLDVSDLKTGLYIIEVNTGKGLIRKKIIII